jgi:hypothetical protein
MAAMRTVENDYSWQKRRNRLAATPTACASGAPIVGVARRNRLAATPMACARRAPEFSVKLTGLPSDLAVWAKNAEDDLAFFLRLCLFITRSYNVAAERI